MKPYIITESDCISIDLENVNYQIIREPAPIYTVPRVGPPTIKPTRSVLGVFITKYKDLSIGEHNLFTIMTEDYKISNCKVLIAYSDPDNRKYKFVGESRLITGVI